jgi:hypothetical protein
MTRAMLAEIYAWFTEGFDTADLNCLNTRSLWPKEERNPAPEC